MYSYKAKVDKVIDGDTIDIIIDLGFDIKVKQRVRLARINTPEVRGEERTAGIKAKEFVEDTLQGVQDLMVNTTKDKKEKYGRYLAEIVFPKDGSNKNLSDLLLEKGLAEEYK